MSGTDGSPHAAGATIAGYFKAFKAGDPEQEAKKR